MSGPRALVVSPMPTHPADRGNRVRARQMTGFLASEGYAVDFVLFPMDADGPDRVPESVMAMQAAWGGIVAIAPPSAPMHRPPRGAHHGIDEWYDPAVDAQVAFLCGRRRYDVMWVNYVFLSRAFAHASPGCLKLLDAHDMLAGRRELFERHGAAPEFFQTTAEEEAVGLRRADAVVAIKGSEASHFSALTQRPVLNVPCCVRVNAGPRRTRGGEAALRVGFIGADNLVNRDNLRSFLDRLRAYRGVFLPMLSMVVAGGVCRHFTAGEPWLELLGAVDDVATFYRRVDLVVAPIAFSTGLKIKIAEALARSVPVVALADAFDGFAAFDRFQSLPDQDSLCAALMTLCADRARLAELDAACRRTFEALAEAERAGLDRLRGMLAARRSRIVIVSDPPARRAGTLAAERHFQTIDYFSRLLPVTLISLCADAGSPAPPQKLPAGVRSLTCATPRSAIAAIEAIEAIEGVAAVFVSLAGASEWPETRWPVIRDKWPRMAAGPAPARRAGRDLALDDGRAIAATPLRHLPGCIDWPWRPDAPKVVLIIAAETIDASLADAVWDCTGARVAVLRTPSLAMDASVVASLASLPRPAAIVTIDADPVTRELAGALANWCGAAHFDLAFASYPLLLRGRMVGNIVRHIETIADWLTSAEAPPGNERSPDAGWSVIWRWIETALRETNELTV